MYISFFTNTKRLKALSCLNSGAAILQLNKIFDLDEEKLVLKCCGIERVDIDCTALYFVLKRKFIV